MENSARARENSSSLGDALEEIDRGPRRLKPRRLAVCAGEAIGLRFVLAREAIVDQRRAERAGDRQAGHVAEDEADEEAGGRARDQRLHAVAVVDMAELVREDAGELVGRCASPASRAER